VFPRDFFSCSLKGSKVRDDGMEIDLLRMMYYRVVDACAMIFPPIGFFSLDAYGPAAASGLDMT
jgi:hypothetical protein